MGFREQFQYSNLMYIVLSHIPPTLLNTTFENYVHDNIFAPLGMNSTTHFYADAAKMGTLAGGFLREDANVTEDPLLKAPFVRCRTGTRAKGGTVCWSSIRPGA